MSKDSGPHVRTLAEALTDINDCLYDDNGPKKSDKKIDVRTTVFEKTVELAFTEATAKQAFANRRGTVASHRLTAINVLRTTVARVRARNSQHAVANAVSNFNALTSTSTSTSTGGLVGALVPPGGSGGEAQQVSLWTDVLPDVIEKIAGAVEEEGEEQSDNESVSSSGSSLSGDSDGDGNSSSSSSDNDDNFRKA